MTESSRFYSPERVVLETRLQCGMCCNPCSQGIFGIGEGRCQMGSLAVWLWLLSFEALEQGKLTGSRVQSTGSGPRGGGNLQS